MEGLEDDWVGEGRGIVWGVANVCVCVMMTCFEVGVGSRNDHTIMTAPLPVCSAKLSMIWSG